MQDEGEVLKKRKEGGLERDNMQSANMQEKKSKDEVWTIKVTMIFTDGNVWASN